MFNGSLSGAISGTTGGLGGSYKPGGYVEPKRKKLRGYSTLPDKMDVSRLERELGDTFEEAYKCKHIST